jgi:iron complex transport system substrate-binding protein
MRWLALVFAVLAWPAFAQGELRDDRGREFRFTQPPARIASLLPSLTETVCALGACARLVGVDRFSNWPAQVTALPRLGGLDDPQVERTVALKPDVVLAPRSSRVVDRLEALGLTVLVFDSDSHEDVRRAVERLARLLGTAVEGERLWSRIDAEIAAAAARVPARLRGRSVYFEVASTPHAAGTTSFIGQTLTRLGLANIATAALGPFPQLNPEFVVRAQPALVMAPAADLATMRARPGWASLDALQRGQVCGFDAPHYEMLVRPGPRMGESAAAIADCLAALPSP